MRNASCCLRRETENGAVPSPGPLNLGNHRRLKIAQRLPVVGVAGVRPGNDGHVWVDVADATVSHADVHAAGVPALCDIPVALLGRRPALEGDAVVAERTRVAAALDRTSLIASERWAAPAVAGVDHGVPGPGRQGTTAPVGTV